jgi:hypothetical protein
MTSPTACSRCQNNALGAMSKRPFPPSPKVLSWAVLFGFDRFFHIPVWEHWFVFCWKNVHFRPWAMSRGMVDRMLVRDINTKAERTLFSSDKKQT